MLTPLKPKDDSKRRTLHRGSRGAPYAAASSTEVDEQARLRIDRARRNRESAQRSREIQKQREELLQANIDASREENNRLKALVEQLACQHDALARQVVPVSSHSTPASVTPAMQTSVVPVLPPESVSPVTLTSSPSVPMASTLPFSTTPSVSAANEEDSHAQPTDHSELPQPASLPAVPRSFSPQLETRQLLILGLLFTLASSRRLPSRNSTPAPPEHARRPLAPLQLVSNSISKPHHWRRNRRPAKSLLGSSQPPPPSASARVGATQHSLSAAANTPPTGSPPSAPHTNGTLSLAALAQHPSVRRLLEKWGPRLDAATILSLTSRVNADAAPHTQ